MDRVAEDEHAHNSAHHIGRSREPAAHDGPAAHGGHEGGGGHDKHAGHSIAMFRDRFWLSFVLTIPTLVWGHMLPRIFGYTPPEFPGSHWIAPALGTIVFLYGGLPFVQGAIRELRARLPGMMTLIALAISVAFVFSVAVTLGFPGMPLWEELATLVTIMLLGHWIEMRSIDQAQGALAELAKLLPGNAVRITLTADGAEHTEDVPIEALANGDLVLVRPGASIPADGEVREGRSNVNEAMITGESRPVLKVIEDHVIAGTVNGEGSLRVAVTGTGERTALAGIMRLVEQAQTSRSRAQVVADRAAYWLTLVALGVGVVTFIAWLVVGAEPAYAVERLVTVLVIACPHALGLAVPLVIAISTTIGARNGLLVRDRRGLEEARLLDAVVFDKTGTLTLGEHRVVGMRAAKGVGQDEALRLAAGVEQDAEHPVAKAIIASATERGLTVPRVTGFEALPGRGVQADFGGRRLAVGGPNLIRGAQIAVPTEIESFATEAAQHAQSVVYLIENGQALAAFAVADAVRPESAEAVRQLHAQGIEVVMLTGDARAVADSVGRQLGIDTVFAEVLPQDKVAKIQELQQQNKRVAMVGDGVNDAPALVAADVGIAIGAGTEVAVEAGDVVLVRSDPRDIPRIIALSRATYQKMVQNLWWASGYNIVAIPLAAGVLAPVGIVLSPAVGAVLMSVSTVIVAINAQLLRRTGLSFNNASTHPHHSSSEGERVMRFSTLIAVAMAAVFASSAPAQDANQPISKLQLSGTVYTADERGNSISAIDLASGKVTVIPVSISPHNVQIAAGGKQLFAVGDPASTARGHDKGAHAAGEIMGRLLVLDSEKLSAGSIASIAVGRHPAHVVVERSGRRAFVTNSGDNTVMVIDLARKTIVRSAPTGRYPHGLRISPDGREIYVANVEDGSVSVIDMQSLKEIERIPVGRAPVQVGFTPDGTRVYVSLRDENAVALIDTASRKKIGTVAVGRGPIQVHATPDGRFVYVANQGSEAEPSETVSIIETASGSVKTIRTGAGAHGVAVSDDGRFVFVSNILANTVSVIDTSSQAVVADFPVGKGPNGITFRPDGSH